MKTATVRSYMAKPGELEQKWWLVDADQKIVGRLASDIAVILMGKHRPTYTPHVDTGDFVVVVNVDKIVFSGKKWEQKRIHLDHRLSGPAAAKRPARVSSASPRRS